MNSSLSDTCKNGNILFFISTKMSSSVLKAFLLTISPSRRQAVFVAALDPFGLDLDIDNSRLLLLDGSLGGSLLDVRMKHALTAFAFAHQISQAIFFDFAEDLRCLASAKALVEIPIKITVFPVVPAPMHRLNQLQCALMLASNPRRSLQYLFMKMLGYPVRLYRFGRGLGLLTQAYLRLDNKHIDLQRFELLTAQTSPLKLPKYIRYLYIEGCESVLSSKAQSHLAFLLSFVSNLTKSRGHTLYIKPRPRNSVYNVKNKPGSTELFCSGPCEDIDMSSATLLTIGSCGALLKHMCVVISFASLLAELCRLYSDRKIIQNQVDYVYSFNHPSLLLPLTMHQLEQQILAT